MYTLIGIILVSALYIYVFYKYIQRQKNDVSVSFSELDEYFKERWELATVLVDLIVSYKLTENSIGNLPNILSVSYEDIEETEKININMQLSSELKNLLINLENVEPLQKDKDFVSLTRNINRINNSIDKSIKKHNESITNYNELLLTFPMNFVAKAFKFEPISLINT